MAKKTASCKQKGRRLQQRIAQTIKTLFNLSDDDVFSNPMGCTGEDIRMSPLARASVPFSIESKNTEKLSIWAALEQAEGENREYKPLLVFSRNRSEDYCALKFSDFLLLLKRIKDLEDEVTGLYEAQAGEGL